MGVRRIASWLGAGASAPRFGNAAHVTSARLSIRPSGRGRRSASLADDHSSDCTFYMSDQERLIVRAQPLRNAFAARPQPRLPTHPSG